MVASCGLESMGKEENLGIAEDFACEVQSSWPAAVESARHADDWMTSTIGKKLVASDE